jgi:hypothetical protein
MFVEFSVELKPVSGAFMSFVGGLIDQVRMNILNQTNFLLKNLGLDLDWIWIQQQPGSKSGFRKMYGSGSGLGD